MFDQSETLCIWCQRACTNCCSWSDHLEPVKGWVAEENKHGYLVRECPEFVKETKESILPAKLDDDGCMLLMEALAKQMREDYVHGNGFYESDKCKGLTRSEIRGKNRQLIEKWLLHGKGRKLLQLSNPEEVIRILRSMARKYETELMQWMR